MRVHPSIRMMGVMTAMQIKKGRCLDFMLYSRQQWMKKTLVPERYRLFVEHSMEKGVMSTGEAASLVDGIYKRTKQVVI